MFEFVILISVVAGLGRGVAAVADVDIPSPLFPPFTFASLGFCGGASASRGRVRSACAQLVRCGPLGAGYSVCYVRVLLYGFCQYLKLLPPMNSRSSEVGGISAGSIGMKLSRNFNSRLASPYSGTVSGTSRRMRSA